MNNIEKARKEKAKANSKKELRPAVNELCVSMPGFSMDMDEMPDMKNHEVGKEYMAKVKMRMTGKRSMKSMMPEGSRTTGDYDIIGMEMMNDEDMDKEHEKEHKKSK